MKGHLFVDTVKVSVKAGKGGDGCVSFRREKYVPRGGPDGGDGGRGGHVIFQADKNTSSLISLFFNPQIRAEDGEKGKGQQAHGRNGEDVIIKVPCGTIIREENSKQIIADLIEDGSSFIVAKGGKGGLGNVHWKTSTHQAPTEFTEGEPGEEKILRLDLKTIGDIGLVGFPNAGKSSLIAAITNAKPKIAAYPFTTLHPVIGTLEFDDGTSLRIVDIPGLIKDAHKGVGLGHTFLRHIERSKLLAFIIDMAGSEGRDPIEDYRTLSEELRKYDKNLLKRTAIIIANKMDLPEAKKNLTLFRKKIRKQIIPISATEKSGLSELKEVFKNIVKPSLLS